MRDEGKLPCELEPCPGCGPWGVIAENKGGLCNGLGNVILFSKHMSIQVSLLAHSREL